MTRILIIEDDPHFRATLCGLLADRFPGARLLECEAGEAALEQLERFSPDLVLTDLKLPGQDGFQVTRRIRNLFPELPVIVLTCFHEPEYEEAAYSAGATHFASKHESSAREILILVETSLYGGEEPKGSNPATGRSSRGNKRRISVASEAEQSKTVADGTGEEGGQPP